VHSPSRPKYANSPKERVHDLPLHAGLGKAILETKRFPVLHDPQPIAPAVVKTILALQHYLPLKRLVFTLL
jgi:hypothetical protein